MHCKPEVSANATLCRSFIATPMSCVAHELLLGAALPMMMAGCVLVCSTSRGGWMHFKPELSANAALHRTRAAPTVNQQHKERSFLFFNFL